MFETEFLEFMRETIIVNRLSGYTDYGTPTHSTASTSFSCRIVRVHESFTESNGAESLIESFVYVASTGTFDPEDRFTFPDGSNPILKVVDSYPDEDGPWHHNRLKFGKRGDL
jgi:hypothetical protein